jgi:hypothetical protein
LRALLLVALVACGALGFGTSAASASACGDRVVADWIDGRIDGVYPLRCYDEAVADLPEDVRVYSSAVDDISRALQARVHSVAGRTPGGKIGGSALASTVDARVSQPPLALILLVASVCVFLLAGASTWLVQSRRRRA